MVSAHTGYIKDQKLWWKGAESVGRANIVTQDIGHIESLTGQYHSLPLPTIRQLITG